MALSSSKQQSGSHHHSSGDLSLNAKFTYGRLEEAVLPYCEDLFILNLEKRALISRKPCGQSSVFPSQQQPLDAGQHDISAAQINCQVEETAHIREIHELQTKDNKASKLVAELQQNVSELSEKLEKKTKENENELHQELRETKKSAFAV